MKDFFIKLYYLIKCRVFKSHLWYYHYETIVSAESSINYTVKQCMICGKIERTLFDD